MSFEPVWLDVESLDLEAQGVARRADGKVVFIEGALPGEQVTVNVSRKKNQWEQGVVSAIRRESAQRVRLAHRLVGAPLDTPEAAVAALAGTGDPWLRSCAAYADPDAGESGRAAGGVCMAEAVVNTLRRVDLSWVRIEIGLLVGALIMGG